jgi:oxygen-dependent protoporphyrinogen oxidase
MTTHSEDGWRIESGPNSALETTPLFKQLFSELNISHEVVYANSNAEHRYILRNSELHLLPLSPAKFIASRLWSLPGKLRLLKEPFIGRAAIEESIAEFVTRRLGGEFLDYAVNPFVAGVFAGSPEKLSVQAALPKLYALEKKYGGLIKGMVLGEKERKHRGEVAKDRAKLFSFVNGMQTLPLALAKKLGASVMLNCTVDDVRRSGKENTFEYSVSFCCRDVSQTLQASAVVLASPSYATANMIRALDPGTADLMESISYAPVTEVFVGFKTKQVKRVMDGFGFLVPEKEQRKILGAIWPSSMFPNRTPDDCVALAVFVGGARQPELAMLEESKILDMVLGELRTLMGTDGYPVFVRTTRWKRAIPQYNLGYMNILGSLEEFEQRHPGLFICSNYKGGISVGDCLMSADKRARAVGRYVSKQNQPAHSNLESCT